MNGLGEQTNKASKKIGQAPGGRTTFSLAWDEGDQTRASSNVQAKPQSQWPESNTQNASYLAHLNKMKQNSNSHIFSSAPVEPVISKYPIDSRSQAPFGIDTPSSSAPFAQDHPNSHQTGVSDNRIGSNKSYETNIAQNQESIAKNATIRQQGKGGSITLGDPTYNFWTDKSQKK